MCQRPFLWRGANSSGDKCLKGTDNDLDGVAKREMTDVEFGRMVAREKKEEAFRKKNVKGRETSSPANEPSPRPGLVLVAITLEPPDKFAMLSQR